MSLFHCGVGDDDDESSGRKLRDLSMAAKTNNDALIEFHSIVSSLSGGEQIKINNICGHRNSNKSSLAK